MRVVFMGTPTFSVAALNALVEANHEIVAVYTQPPRPAGRGKKDRKSDVHLRAEALGIEVRHPRTLRDKEIQAEFDALQVDVGVVVAYGLILPQAVLDAPRLGCLNIHASLLPRWRGAAPIHRAIMAGDTETGVCIMQMDTGLDTGPVLLRKETDIGMDETTGDLHDRLSALGADAVVETLAQIDSLDPQPQSADGITYAQKIEKSEARIDWQASAEAVDRQIRGLSPFPGAWCEVDGERIKLLRSRVASGDAPPGTHLGEFRIACGNRAVQVLEAQRQGKRAMSAEDILRGLTLPEKL